MEKLFFSFLHLMLNEEKRREEKRGYERKRQIFKINQQSTRLHRHRSIASYSLSLFSVDKLTNFFSREAP
jgi:hypothetical protein